jgi:hypothetical protein
MTRSAKLGGGGVRLLSFYCDQIGNPICDQRRTLISLKTNLTNRRFSPLVYRIPTWKLLLLIEIIAITGGFGRTGGGMSSVVVS